MTYQMTDLDQRLFTKKPLIAIAHQQGGFAWTTSMGSGPIFQVHLQDLIEDRCFIIISTMINYIINKRNNLKTQNDDDGGDGGDDCMAVMMAVIVMVMMITQDIRQFSSQNSGCIHWAIVVSQSRSVAALPPGPGRGAKLSSEGLGQQHQQQPEFAKTITNQIAKPIFWVGISTKQPLVFVMTTVNVVVLFPIFKLFGVTGSPPRHRFQQLWPPPFDWRTLPRGDPASQPHVLENGTVQQWLANLTVGGPTINDILDYEVQPTWISLGFFGLLDLHRNLHWTSVWRSSDIFLLPILRYSIAADFMRIKIGITKWGHD